MIGCPPCGAMPQRAAYISHDWRQYETAGTDPIREHRSIGDATLFRLDKIEQYSHQCRKDRPKHHAGNNQAREMLPLPFRARRPCCPAFTAKRPSARTRISHASATPKAIHPLAIKRAVTKRDARNVSQKPDKVKTELRSPIPNPIRNVCDQAPSTHSSGK